MPSKLHALFAFALCLMTSASAFADTDAGASSATPMPPVTEQDKTMPLGWRDAPKTSEDNTSDQKTSGLDCDNAAYAKPEVHGVVSAGIATGSHMGTVTGEAGAVSLTKRLGDCDRPSGAIGISVGTSRINGGSFR